MLGCGQIAMTRTLHPQENAESCNNKQGAVFYQREIPVPSAILSQQEFLEHPRRELSKGKQEVVFSIPKKMAILLAVNLLCPVFIRLDLP